MYEVCVPVDDQIYCYNSITRQVVEVELNVKESFVPRNIETIVLKKLIAQREARE